MGKVGDFDGGREVKKKEKKGGGQEKKTR